MHRNTICVRIKQQFKETIKVRVHFLVGSDSRPTATLAWLQQLGTSTFHHLLASVKSYILDLVYILHVSALWFPQSSFLVVKPDCVCVSKGVESAVSDLVADCIS